VAGIERWLVLRDFEEFLPEVAEIWFLTEAEC
jgi:hypothetical protein